MSQLDEGTNNLPILDYDGSGNLKSYPGVIQDTGDPALDQKIRVLLGGGFGHRQNGEFNLPLATDFRDSGCRFHGDFADFGSNDFGGDVKGGGENHAIFFEGNMQSQGGPEPAAPHQRHIAFFIQAQLMPDRLFQTADGIALTDAAGVTKAGQILPDLAGIVTIELGQFPAGNHVDALVNQFFKNDQVF